MTKVNQEKIAKRIRDLLSKTTSNGCTEEEAIMAAEKAGELMDKYNLSFSQVQMKEQKCKKGTFHTRNDHTAPRAHEVQIACAAIATYCDCKVWKDGAKILYFGMPKDVEIAEYLSALIKSAMDSDFQTYKKSPDRPEGVHGQRLRASFMVGMAGRVAARLREMKKARETGHKPTGKSLVVTKHAVVTEAFAALGLRLGKGSSGSAVNNSDAYYAGKAAGDKVAINPGIGGQASAGLLS
jgi:hypothetical protein